MIAKLDVVYEANIFLVGVPIALNFALVPFIMDLVNGHDITGDITIQRAREEDGIS